MNLRQLILTQNECYIVNRERTRAPAGIMVHSTAANNTKLSRYVGPNDGVVGSNPNNNHWNQFRPDGRQVCVHAFIGTLPNGSIATYQTLPWDIPGWHSGSGNKGPAADANNTGYIGFEICEDDTNGRTYFNAVYKEAVELCAYLCRLYGIKPESPWLICHREGGPLGIASNSADVLHWFPKHGKSMDDFRADVQKEMAANANTSNLTPITGQSTATAAQMAAYIKSVNKNVPQSVIDILPLYLTEGAVENIRGDVAFAQSCLETGNFTFAGSAVTLGQNNFCGMGVTGTGMKGNSFPTAQIGIRAQIHHLKHYANTEPLANPNESPRSQFVQRGCAPYVEWLGQKENPEGRGWAVGEGYGGKILTILSNVLRAAPAPQYYRVQLGAFAVKPNAEAMLAKVRAAGFDAFITHG